MASFRFSLRLLGAELEGGQSTAPPPPATTCSAAEAASARVSAKNVQLRNTLYRPVKGYEILWEIWSSLIVTRIKKQNFAPAAQHHLYRHFLHLYQH